MVNHEIRYADQLQCPGPPEVAASAREATLTGGTPLRVSGNQGGRLVKVRQSAWGYLACNSPVLWLNKVGTFGVASTPHWWARLIFPHREVRGSHDGISLVLADGLPR